MLNNSQFLNEVVSKAFLNLSITYRSGNNEAFRERVAATLNASDNQLFVKFEDLKLLNIKSGSGKAPSSLEAVFEDVCGNQVTWVAGYVNEGGTSKGPFRLKGGLIVSRLVIDENVDLSA